MRRWLTNKWVRRGIAVGAAGVVVAVTVPYVKKHTADLALSKKTDDGGPRITRQVDPPPLTSIDLTRIDARGEIVTAPGPKERTAELTLVPKYQRAANRLLREGAVPMGVLLSYQLNGAEPRFLVGLAEALDEYGARLLGGDTVSSDGPQVLGLTAIGRASFLPVPGRNGAQVGDLVYITGPVGGAMVGLEALRLGLPESQSLAYRRPQAHLAEGQALAPFVTAMMDVSDGLLLDASRMARASKVTINLEAAAIPLACPRERRDEALRWGDDYQLLLTAPPELTLPLPMHRIGVVGKRQETPVLINGVPPHGSLGYQH